MFGRQVTIHIPIYVAVKVAIRSDGKHLSRINYVSVYKTVGISSFFGSRQKA